MNAGLQRSKATSEGHLEDAMASKKANLRWRAAKSMGRGDEKTVNTTATFHDANKRLVGRF